MVHKRNELDFMEKANYIFDNQYDYSQANCKDWNSKWLKIKVICPKHGIFEVTPFDHLKNFEGCPKCEKPRFLTASTTQLLDEYLKNLKPVERSKYLTRYQNILSIGLPVNTFCKLIKCARITHVLKFLNIETFEEKKSQCVTFQQADLLRNFIQKPFSEKRKDLLKDTIQNKYGEGFTHNSQLQFVKDKKEKTYIEKYGVKNAHQIPGIVEKAQESTFRRFGKYGGLGRSGTRSYTYDNMFFDSSWELYFYIYQKLILGNKIRRGDIFHYTDSTGKDRTYECDFKINDNLNVEVKGTQFLKNIDGQLFLVAFDTKELLVEKTNCMRKNDVQLILEKDIEKIQDIVDAKFPGLIQSCKKVKK